MLALAACGGGNPERTAGQPLSAPVTAGPSTATRNFEIPVDPQERIHIGFSAKLSDPQGLEDYIAQMYDPFSENFHKTLTPEAVRERFGPTSEQIAALTAFMQSKGFRNVKVPENRLLVEADVSIGVVQSVFATTLKKFILPDGTMGHINTTKPSIPGEIADLVTAVHGLDTVNRFRTHNVKSQMTTQVSTATMPSGTMTGHNPLDFPRIYNVGSTSTASNQTVGIITWGDPTQSVNDLHTFERLNGLPATNTAIIVTGTPSSFTGDTVEWSMDSQSIVAMSGGVKQLRFYTAEQGTFLYALNSINSAINDPNRPQVVSMSFGICDMSGESNFDGFFAVAVAQGQTFVASSGDHGSSCQEKDGPLYPNTTWYPASSKYVVNVGGTTLGTTGSTVYAGETAWSGSGGGDSKYVTAPFWHAIVPMLSGKQYRSGPDVSFVGNPDTGANIVANGSTVLWGGTSLSAPLFAATWARLQQTCGTNLGFAGPTLYRYANSNPNIYRDVTMGSNGTYSAAKGWDKVTGWGTINIDNMRAALCPGAAFFAGTEALYVAYLGRPVEPSGLAYWSAQMKTGSAPTTLSAFVSSYGSNSTVTSIVNSLANSPEFNALYGTSDVNAYVTKIYNVLFNRTPESSGLTYWADRINSGALPRQLAPLAIMNAALSSRSADTWIAGNKFAVAMNFTSTLTTTTASYYSGSTAAASARHLLQNVSYTTTDPVEFGVFAQQSAYVSRYQSSVSAAISSIVAGIPY